MIHQLRSGLFIFAITMVVGCGLVFQADAQQGRVVSPTDPEFKNNYVGKKALIIELRKALDNDLITREELWDAMVLTSRTDDGVAANAAKAFELTQDFNEVLIQLILDRTAVQPPPPELKGKIVSAANAPYRVKYRGRTALVITVRLAFDRGQITQEEMLQIKSLVSNIDDAIAGTAAKSFRRNGDFNELTTTLELNQNFVTQELAIDRQERCNAEAHGFFLGCMFAGGNANSCGEQQDSYWCGCMNGTYLGQGFCYFYG
jgi:hypothetical protein